MKKTVVVKFGGSLSKNERAKNAFLDSFAALSKKARVVLVHGGGPEINHWLNKLKIISRFVGGLRVTEGPALEVVEMVLSGKVNKGLVADLSKRGLAAVGISGKDGGLLICKQIKRLGFVGEPAKVNPELLKTLMNGGFIPVVSSLAADAKGQTLNVNADHMAMALAAGLKADKLVLLTDVPGVLDADKKTIKSIKISGVKGLLKYGVITGGMIPKIKACSAAVKKGVKEVWIADGSKGLNKLTGTVIKK